MVNLVSKASDVRRSVGSRVDVSGIDVDGDTVTVDVEQRGIGLQGEAAKDLSEVRAAIRKEIRDVVGYDVEFEVLVNLVER